MRYTPNINLFEYEETQEDGNEKFLIQRALNDNWDKLDTIVKAIQDEQANMNSIINSINQIIEPVPTMKAYIIDVTGGGLMVS